MSQHTASARPAPLFAKGASVEILTATIAVADGSDEEVNIPAGTSGTVADVRECGEWPRPLRDDYEQGPWLYDVEAYLEGGWMAWLIYDAGDAHNLRPISESELAP
jgi:hypothetical protein